MERMAAEFGEMLTETLQKMGERIETTPTRWEGMPVTAGAGAGALGGGGGAGGEKGDGFSLPGGQRAAGAAGAGGGRVFPPL